MSNVNHPKHYNNSPSGVECITVVEHMPFNIGNAIKYLWRCDDKDNPLEDLQKAKWYVDREIDRRITQQKEAEIEAMQAAQLEQEKVPYTIQGVLDEKLRMIKEKEARQKAFEQESS